MKILVSNDDGYRAQGITVLSRIMDRFGDVTVVAPKYHQSATSMGLSMGFKPIAVKRIEDRGRQKWYYVDGTPASCVKYAMANIFKEEKPDLAISGINHGANAATAVCYSATVGAAQEACLSGVISIAVSLDDMKLECDFSAVERFLPEIITKIIASGKPRYGSFYNINFPKLPADKIKGVRIAHQGIVHWEKEFQHYDIGIFKKIGANPSDFGIMSMPEAEDGEEQYVMTGSLVDDPINRPDADHRLLAEGYITVTLMNIDMTDYEGCKKLESNGLNTDF